MYDAIVIGARGAGSLTAMLLARQGYRVLLLDRASFPSDAISTHYNHQPGIARLARWGLLDRVIASNCPPVRTTLFDLGPFALAGERGRSTGSPMGTVRAARCWMPSWRGGGGGRGRVARAVLGRGVAD